MSKLDKVRTISKLGLAFILFLAVIGALVIVTGG